MVDLKPCPFCGGTKIRTTRRTTGHGQSESRERCKTCGAEGPGDYGAVAGHTWNSSTDYYQLWMDSEKRWNAEHQKRREVEERNPWRPMSELPEWGQEVLVTANGQAATIVYKGDLWHWEYWQPFIDPEPKEDPNA